MQGIRKFSKAIGILKCYVNKDINIGHIEILLTLAENEPDPVPYSTLNKMTGNSTASISKSLKILGECHLKDLTNGEWVDIGLGLVKTFPSPNDSEEYLAFLTDKGRKLVWMLNELIK